MKERTQERLRMGFEGLDTGMHDLRGVVVNQHVMKVL